MARVTTTTETITPALAEQWLEKNKQNRPLRDHHVTSLAKEMREGRWMLNGEAIVFDDNGDLLDGQHRLWAAFDHGQTFQSVVVRGVDPASFGTIDSGMKRSAGDVLTKAGVQYGTLVGAAIRLIHFYATGRRDHAVVQRMSNAETLELVQKYPRVTVAVELVGPSAPLKVIVSQTAMTAAVYSMLEDDAEATREFVEAIASGEGLRRGDARLTLRNMLINAKGLGRRLHHRIQFALIIKAWNAWRTGRELTSLRFVDAEEFPVFNHHQQPSKKRPLRAAA